MSFLSGLKKIFEPSSFQPAKAKEPKKKQPIRAGGAKKAFLTQKTIRQTETRAREIILEAKDEAFKIKSEANEQARKIERQALEAKEKAGRLEIEIEAKKAALQEREKAIQSTKEDYDQKLTEIEKIKKQQLAKLERAAGLTAEEAKKLILEAVEKKLTGEIGYKIKEVEDKTRESADKKAREILVDAMYHGATDYVAEYTISSVKLTDEDMKGRIIGKEGRNIRAFEKATGVDVDLDEENVIRLSSFDSVRREIAKIALEKLMADGRIQPSRIEQIVEKTKNELEKIMYQAGQDLCHQLRVYNLPHEVIAVLGRFKYRFSYGQNMISHTLEETKIGIYLANQIGADASVVRLGCLLHDIGKVITDEEGSHAKIGADFLRKFDIPQSVLDCVAQHHEEEPFSSTEAVLVYIADAISGSRPGARYKDYQGYVDRLDKLEKIAQGFKGVKKAYAIQAGREIRVIVNPEKVSDAAAVKLAADMRDKIKKEVTYAGQVQITVIRETRVIEIAK